MFRLKKWDELPEFMQNDDVAEYYGILSRHKASIFIKRCFDITAAVLIAVVLLPAMAVLAVMIKTDSPGPVIFCQERVTAYGRKFRIYKFRTMVNGADKRGAAVTSKADARITRVGKLLRSKRLDELPQVFNVIKGDMSFVGTRPEVPGYVAKYQPYMTATLLLPAGITSITSILYKDEERLLENAADADYVYINRVLPEKMQYNLRAIREFSMWNDIKIMLMTVFAVFGVEYKNKYKMTEDTKKLSKIN